MKKFAKKCDCCGKGMNEGYHDAGAYYCSDECLLQDNREMNNPNYTMKDWEKDHEESPGSCYYTEWEEIDEEEFYDADGNVYYSCNLCHKQVSEPCCLCKQTLSKFKT